MTDSIAGMESDPVSLAPAASKAAEADADEAAILAMLRAETEAWLRRDFAALAGHWVHSPKTRRMEAFAALGVRVDQGWEAIAARLHAITERFTETRRFEDCVRWENVNVVVEGDMAWVSYDQIGIDAGDDLKRILKIVQRIDGAWKIGCMALMESPVFQAREPLVEVAPDRRVLWMNGRAQDRMRGHRGLVLAAGRLRARQPGRAGALRDAVRQAFTELASQRPLTVVARQAWAVPLGEDDAGARLYCWVLLEDGKVFVTFGDDETVARRISAAGALFGLSPAQLRLARTIVDGKDLAEAAGVLGVSVNTVRTQLRRMFDKTGARSQAALVRALLGAEVPTG